MACEAPLHLAINVLQTHSYCHDPIPAHAKTELKNYLPLWCTRPAASHRLVAIGSDKVYPLDSGESFVTVGRNVSAKVVLSSLSVSRMHAALMHDSLDQTFIVDLGSTHGTFIGSERVTPYVPTLLTKKSLIRFGTCEVQYLLLTLCAEECILQQARQLECAEERDVFLNTQFNLRNVCPTGCGGMEPDAEFFGRLNTFNFKNTTMQQHLLQLDQPSLTRCQVSSGSVETCGNAADGVTSSPNYTDNTMSVQHQLRVHMFTEQEKQPVAIRSPANFQNFSVQFQQQSSCRARQPTLDGCCMHSDQNGNGCTEPSLCVAKCRAAFNDGANANAPPSSVVPALSPIDEGFKFGNGLSISPSISPNELAGSFFTECDSFINAGNSLSSEPSIKRCATMAGVDEEQECLAFAHCGQGDGDAGSLNYCDPPLPPYSPRQHRRRRMSEEPFDFAMMERSGSRAMSMSMEAVECASIGGSSNGFISSGSMSECEEEAVGADGKKKKKVRFGEFPTEIAAPVTATPDIAAVAVTVTIAGPTSC